MQKTSASHSCQLFASILFQIQLLLLPLCSQFTRSWLSIRRFYRWREHINARLCENLSKTVARRRQKVIHIELTTRTVRLVTLSAWICILLHILMLLAWRSARMIACSAVGHEKDRNEANIVAIWWIIWLLLLHLLLLLLLCGWSSVSFCRLHHVAGTSWNEWIWNDVHRRMLTRWKCVRVGGRWRCWRRLHTEMAALRAGGIRCARWSWWICARRRCRWPLSAGRGGVRFMRWNRCECRCLSSGDCRPCRRWWTCCCWRCLMIMCIVSAIIVVSCVKYVLDFLTYDAN